MGLLIVLGWMAASGGSSVAQTASPGDRYLAPQKDIAVLVDVSRSVEKPRGGSYRDVEAIEDAKIIIKDLITGRGFNATKYSKSDWTIQPGQDTSLNNLFARYLGPSTATATSAELTALAKPNGSLLILPVGNLSTVIKSGTINNIKSIAPYDLDSLMEKKYPTIGDMNDTSTCFWFAMARAAETLSEQSRDGYYLFVASDEIDDPDYRKDGPQDHTEADYPLYLKSLADTWPVSSIRNTIDRYFTPHPQGEDRYKVEQYTPRTGFAKTLIAKFYRRNATANQRPVSVSWYAMGVVPQVIYQPQSVAAAPPPTVLYRAPTLTPSIKFLGGLDRGTQKTYDYDQPLVSWQIVNGNLADLNEIGSNATLTAKGAGRPFIKRLEESGRKNQPHTLQLTSLKPAEYELKLDITGAEPLSIQAAVKYEPRTDFWLMVLAITSLVAAVGIFFFAWRNLRETRVVPLS